MCPAIIVVTYLYSIIKIIENTNKTVVFLPKFKLNNF